MIQSTVFSYALNGNESTRMIAGNKVIVYKLCQCGNMIIKNDVIINKRHDVYDDKCTRCVLVVSEYSDTKKYNRLRPIYEGMLA